MTLKKIVVLSLFLLLSYSNPLLSQEETALIKKIVQAELQVQNEEFLNKFNKFASSSRVRELKEELHFLIYAIWEFNEDGSFYVACPTLSVMPAYIGYWKPLENGNIELVFEDPDKKELNKNIFHLRKPQNFKKLLITKMRLSGVTKKDTFNKDIVPIVKMEIEQIE